jgi:hypothetical protein
MGGGNELFFLRPIRHRREVDAELNREPKPTFPDRSDADPTGD